MPDKITTDTRTAPENLVFLHTAEEGFRHSRINNGDTHALKINMNRIFRKLLNSSSTDEAAYKATFRDQLITFRLKDNALSQRIAAIKSIEKEKIHEQIAQYRLHINGLRYHDDENGHRHENTLVFNLLRGCMIVIMGYLFIFFSSAGLATFFSIPPGNTLPDIIYNIHAFEQAWRIGLGAVVVVLTVPLLFFGIGYLIHLQADNGRFAGSFRAALLALAALFLNTALSFIIAGKMHQSVNSDTPLPFTLQAAAADSNFWMILVAGLLIYLVWNMLLEIVLHAQRRRSHINRSIRENKNNIRESEERLLRLDIEFNELTRHRDELKQQTMQLEAALGKRYINITACEQVLLEYLSGWIASMNQQRMSAGEIQQARQDVETFLENIKKEFCMIGA